MTKNLTQSGQVFESGTSALYAVNNQGGQDAEVSLHDGTGPGGPRFLRVTVPSKTAIALAYGHDFPNGCYAEFSGGNFSFYAV